jgi:hypothetical protein
MFHKLSLAAAAIVSALVISSSAWANHLRLRALERVFWPLARRTTPLWEANMKRRRKLALLAVLLLTQCLGGVQFADANVVYAYTGNDFTSIYSAAGLAIPTRITATLTLSSPLGDNVVASPIPISYTISDGPGTANAGSVTYLALTTDSVGTIVNWEMVVQVSSPAGDACNSLPGTCAIFATQNTPLGVVMDEAENFAPAGTLAPYTFYQLAINQNDPGSWAVATQAVPGPIAGAGLPGLIFAGGGLLVWWCRKRRACEPAIRTAG